MKDVQGHFKKLNKLRRAKVIPAKNRSGNRDGIYLHICPCCWNVSTKRAQLILINLFWSMRCRHLCKCRSVYWWGNKIPLYASLTCGHVHVHPCVQKINKWGTSAWLEVEVLGDLLTAQSISEPVKSSSYILGGELRAQLRLHYSHLLTWSFDKSELAVAIAQLNVTSSEKNNLSVKCNCQSSPEAMCQLNVSAESQHEHLSPLSLSATFSPSNDQHCRLHHQGYVCTVYEHWETNTETGTVTNVNLLSSLSLFNPSALTRRMVPRQAAVPWTRRRVLGWCSTRRSLRASAGSPSCIAPTRTTTRPPKPCRVTPPSTVRGE